MSYTKQSLPIASKSEIKRLLRAAKTYGSTDNYAGKRQSTRSSDGMKLEVTTDPDNPAATWAVTMHDISEGGLSFWSRQELELGKAICLREFSTSDASRSWISARVKHRTMGLRGYLIGACFEANGVSSAPSPPQARGAPVLPPQNLPPGWRGPRT